MAAKKAAPKGRKKVKKVIATGIAVVNATFNNTLITISDVQGNTIAQSSAGAQGFKGSRKSTPFAAQMAATDAIEKAKEHGVKELQKVYLKGPGSGRESAVRALAAGVDNVEAIIEATPIPHNGVRRKKKRRV